MNAQEKEILFLGTEIGRGHPFYLDGLYEEFCAKLGREATKANVFTISRGISLRAWKAVRASYHMAGSGQLSSAIYRRLRGHPDYEADTWTVRILARDIRRWARGKHAIVVDHPLVAGALRGHPRIWYMHGEMAVPRESAVKSAAGIFVPCEDAANVLASLGVERSRIRMTGLCIERSLRHQAEKCFHERQLRLNGNAPLTAAFFSSGAEPAHHVKALATAAVAFAQAGHRALVFAGRGGRLEREVGPTSQGLEVVSFSNRSNLDQRTAVEFPTIDVLVSPPHERSTWAAGLGLPIFLVGPDIGPFAPLNRAVLFRKEVAAEIDGEHAQRFPEMVANLRRRGRLSEMSRNGWGAPMDGFACAARVLFEEGCA
jgi:hypothetical protein